MSRFSLEDLYALIQCRHMERPDGSYTAQLFSAGISKIAQKVGEEAVETVIEAIRGDRQLLIQESADLLYHLLVLWVGTGITPCDVQQELAKRHSMEYRNQEDAS